MKTVAPKPIEAMRFLRKCEKTKPLPHTSATAEIIRNSLAQTQADRVFWEYRKIKNSSEKGDSQFGIFAKSLLKAGVSRAKAGKILSDLLRYNLRNAKIPSGVHPAFMEKEIVELLLAIHYKQL
ncbi:MAG: hypothetical protein V1494_00415 [Candidatus Diapherotrites archaeon]